MLDFKKLTLASITVELVSNSLTVSIFSDLSVIVSKLIILSEEL